MSARAIGIQYLDEPFIVPVKGTAPPVKASSADGKKPPAPATPTPATTIEIKLALPQLPQLPTKDDFIRRLRGIDKRTILIGGSALMIVTIMAGASVYMTNFGSPHDDNSVVTNPLDRLQKGTPQYATMLPAGKSIDKLGGWTRISPPDRNPVFAYTDKIDGAPISVSQQPLPNDFKNDTDKKIEELARSFKADQKLTVGTSAVFIGTSASGPQSVILEKNDILVLMKSSVRIDSKKWADYVSSLR